MNVNCSLFIFTYIECVPLQSVKYSGDNAGVTSCLPNTT